MEKFSKEEILAEVDQVAAQLAELEEIQRFKELEARLNENDKVKKLIEQIKGLQKQAVNLQAYGKQEAVKQIDEQIDQVQAEIDAIPIVEEFKGTQVVVNDLLQTMVQSITQQVAKKIEQ
ncbi:cell fate (sporulation/competence/biofilm development) regulator YmcA (YheA/YmcA/DUF963 family) [Natronobacillus azotifigens]|uniref:YlbF family regulator n=1 Tax=Natronobacillus azotifigens TaxID=472978 RepID=A0A9J6RBN2_9BACI|nr:YlbF family regulator [Natronobacillus azotifigens]MCZ0702633.1 YlbF family regulator [Natronobacillus azotifigens]